VVQLYPRVLGSLFVASYDSQGLRWRYSNPPPHGSTHTLVEVEVKLRLMVSQPVHLGVRHPSGTRDQVFFLLEIFFRQLQVCYFVAPSLTRGWVCNFLLLLALASSVPRDSRPQPGGPGPCVYIPQEWGGPDIPPGTGFPFCRLLRLAGLRWRYSNPPPHGMEYTIFIMLRQTRE
jgi:hypothetical protein